MSEQEARNLVVALGESYLGARCLLAAAELGVADHLDDRPRGMADLAAALGVDADALGRVARYLAALGIFVVQDGRLAHNDASRLLRRDHPQSVHPMLAMFAMPVLWDSVGALTESVRTGTPGARLRHAGGFFGYLAEHPEESRVYDRGMTSMTTSRLPRMVGHLDLSGYTTIADIGGGRGHLLGAVLEAAPHARGILVDLPHVVRDAVPHERMVVRPGSFLTDPLPEADCYLLSNVIHDWPDDEARRILRAVRDAAPPRSTLMLFEFVVPDDAEPFDASDIDVWMLALVGGRERTLAEYRRLLADAGWSLRYPLATEAQTVMVAEPV